MSIYKKQEVYTYRVWANGEVMFEDDFDAIPENYSDDYVDYQLPEVLLEHIESNFI
jgi:hypothetical protein